MGKLITYEVTMVSVILFAHRLCLHFRVERNDIGNFLMVLCFCVFAVFFKSRFAIGDRFIKYGIIAVTYITLATITIATGSNNTTTMVITAAVIATALLTAKWGAFEGKIGYHCLLLVLLVGALILYGGISF